MKGNAEQMLKIAKQFYPSLDFDIPQSRLSSQSESESGGVLLQRLWQNTTTANFEDKTSAQQSEILDKLSTVSNRTGAKQTSSPAQC